MKLLLNLKLDIINIIKMRSKKLLIKKILIFLITILEL